jgi:hypothetical protein
MPKKRAEEDELAQGKEKRLRFDEPEATQTDARDTVWLLHHDIPTVVRN